MKSNWTKPTRHRKQDPVSNVNLCAQTDFKRSCDRAHVTPLTSTPLTSDSVPQELNFVVLNSCGSLHLSWRQKQSGVQWRVRGCRWCVCMFIWSVWRKGLQLVWGFVFLSVGAEQSRSCCKNGGTCILGSFCACPPFFTGRSCEYDQRIR